LLLSSEIRRQDLQRDFPFEASIENPVDLAHAARAGGFCKNAV
jgi:hypothetical protein